MLSADRLINRIQFLCNEGNISISKMLSSCGLKKSTVDNLKKGSIPSIDKLQKISEYFNVPLKFFTDEPPFDSWEYLNSSRKALLRDMWISENQLFLLTGTADINSLTAVQFIRFLDSAIEDILVTPEGELNVHVKTWTQLSRDVEKVKTSEIMLSVSKAIPVLGMIRAGAPLLAEENILGYEFADVAHPEEYFFLRVSGDSMINAGIKSGSKVLVHKQDYAEDGQIVVCLVNGDEATLKRFRQGGNAVMLIPENPAYNPLLVPCSDFDNGTARILGVAKKVLSDL